MADGDGETGPKVPGRKKVRKFLGMRPEFAEDAENRMQVGCVDGGLDIFSVRLNARGGRVNRRDFEAYVVFGAAVFGSDLAAMGAGAARLRAEYGRFEEAAEKKNTGTSPRIAGPGADLPDDG